MSVIIYQRLACSHEETVCFFLDDHICSIVKRIIIYNLPLWIAESNILFQGFFFLWHSYCIHLILIKVFLISYRHQAVGPGCVCKCIAIFFCEIRISAGIKSHINLTILQRLNHFVIIIICLYIKFQCLISQTIFGIGGIFRQHTGKFSSLFIHGKDCRIIVQKSYLDTSMLFHPDLFFTCK